MKLFIIMADAFEDFKRIVHRRLSDRDRLKAALQCGVLFNILAVLCKRCGADDLNLAAGKRRL